jgi:hypothetical protein
MGAVEQVCPKYNSFLVYDCATLNQTAGIGYLLMH